MPNFAAVAADLQDLPMQHFVLADIQLSARDLLALRLDFPLRGIFRWGECFPSLDAANPLLASGHSQVFG